MIVLADVSRTFGSSVQGVAALKPLSLRIDRGEKVAIMGPSGSGKSTLLHLLGALDRPTSGRVTIDDVNIADLDDRARTLFRRARIGFIFQFFHLLETLTARENVLLAARLSGRVDRVLEKRAEHLLEVVGLLDRAGHFPAQMSGGELQRVAVARALLMDPPVVLADEPTGNLDSENGAIVLDLLMTATSTNQTLVVVTHDPKVAHRADRLLTLKDGRLVADRSGHPRKDSTEGTLGSHA